MSNKSKQSKTKITKISASSSKASAEKQSAPVTKPQKKTSAKTSPKNPKNNSPKPLKQVFILARPFVALGRYLRDSWNELRQVRWPNRKNTWKMTIAVLVYCAIFIVFIVLLDTFFTFVFNLLLTK